MSNNFHWHSEEDGWDEAEGGDKTPAPATLQLLQTKASRHGRFSRFTLRRTILENRFAPGRHWSVWLLGLGLILTVASLLAYWQINRRLTAVTHTVETAVQDSQQIVHQAATTADSDLLVTVLSGGDADWSAAQQLITSAGLFYARPSFTLDYLAQPQVISVTLAPDLTEAQVLTENTYALDVGNGLTQTIALRQTAVFRPGADRWLLAKPTDAFWGQITSSQGRYLTLNYPTRDQKIAQRLAAELDAHLNALCLSLPAPGCPADFHFTVTLTTNPADLQAVPVSVADPVYHLPTPTLVGLPTDAAGYLVLVQGYKEQVVTAVLSYLSPKTGD